MRPLRLRLRGFGPFRDETDIDFDDLELFALVGDTGSGKSTIIDALTFALYGSVVRYDDMRLVAPVINTQSNEATVMLDFSVADTEYRATRVVRRTANGATTAEARLECGETVLAASRAELNDAIEALIGLNFSRFIKVIVLPQGRFASFLHDGASDRQELLRDLLDLGIYQRMRTSAHDRRQRASQRQEAIDATLDAIGVSDEAVAMAQADAATATHRHRDIAAAASTWRDLAHRSAAADYYADEIGVLALAYGALTVPDEVERFDETFAAVVAALDDAVGRAEGAREERDRLVAALDAAPSIEALDAHLARYERRDRLNAEVAIDTERLAQLGTDRDRLVERLAEVRAEVEAAETALRSAEATRDEARDALDAGPQRDEIQGWLQAIATLDEREADVATAAADLEVSAERMAARAQSLDDAQADRDRAAHSFEAAQLADRVAAVALTVSIGDDCPVCGNVVEALTDHGAGRDDLVVLGERLRGADTAVTIARDEAAQAKAEHVEAQRRLDSAVAKRDQARGDVVVDRDDAVAAMADWERRRGALEETETVRAQAELRLRSLRDGAAIDATAEALRTLDTTLATITAEQGQRRRSLDELDAELLGAASVDEIATQRAEIGELHDALAHARATLASAESAVEAAAERRDDLHATEVAFRRDFHRVRDRFSGALGAPDNSGGSVADEWRQLATWAESQSAVALGLFHDEQSRADALRAERDVAAAAVVEAAGAGEVTSSRSDAVESLSEDVIEGLVSAAAAAESTAQSRLALLLEQQTNVAEQRRERDELHEEITVYGQLHRLLRTSGFEAWLLNDILFDLVERASERLHVLSQGQYSLEVGSDRFDVIDHRNGDERRMAKTLSGGETFTASLALALALADVLGESPTSTSPPIEALFLDEGFGTLDPEHLDVVASVLEELGSAGRMVGVVTHIRALADRMPVRLEVAAGARSATVKRVEG